MGIIIVIAIEENIEENVEESIEENIEENIEESIIVEGIIIRVEEGITVGNNIKAEITRIRTGCIVRVESMRAKTISPKINRTRGKTMAITPTRKITLKGITTLSPKPAHLIMLLIKIDTLMPGPLILIGTRLALLISRLALLSDRTIRITITIIIIILIIISLSMLLLNIIQYNQLFYNRQEIIKTSLPNSSIRLNRDSLLMTR